MKELEQFYLTKNQVRNVSMFVRVQHHWSGYNTNGGEIRE